ncbi:unnamed protein product [Adineta ricciae]|uniref:alanine transaminase n=1 Tax=Adineta ricciae TaxID=249248 RepID=A0A816CNX1_ADIRI|nr:unnamed protein product [Adineta ricciae]
MPITYIRQFIAGCANPALLNSFEFPSDVKERVERVLNICTGKTFGSYSESPGIKIIRHDIASYIQQRDGYPSDPNNIYLSNGAAGGIETVLKLLMNNSKKPSGIMIPVPQFPFYSAILTQFGAHQIEYFLDEDNGWPLHIDELERALNESKARCIPRGIVIINPGNPTAHKHNLFLLADEVYQENVHSLDSKFVSFKKILMDLGSPYNQMQIASFHSASKGWHCESGFRGGYFEITNLDKDVKAQVNKLVSLSLCSNTWGQAVMGAIVNPPKEGEPSYELYKRERSMMTNRLQEQATLINELFNSMEGIICNPVKGGMFAFPRVEVPCKAIEYAKSKDMTPDNFYCVELLENTGICVLPGSIFKQRPGTYHFRTNILLSAHQIKDMAEKFRTFHVSFMHRWQ